MCWKMAGCLARKSSALALNLKHNSALHEHIVLLKVSTERRPRVSENGRVVVHELGKGIRQLTAIEAGLSRSY